jgi:hypothetical protein
MPGLFRRLPVAAPGLAAILTFASASFSQTTGTPERYTANAINMNISAAGPIEIVVDRWSTDAQRDKLMAVMLSGGPEKLLDTLQDMPRMGYFRAPGNLGWDIHFARKVPLPEGGERVVLVTDRRIGFREAVAQPRSIDYPFTVIELRLNRDGEGEGKMSIATKIVTETSHNIITLENYDTQPVQLTNVRRERASK